MLFTNQLKATSTRAVRCKLSFPQIISIIRGVKKTSGAARKVLTELQAVLLVQLVLLLHQGVDSAQTTSMPPTAKLTGVISLFIAPVSSPGPGLLTGAIKSEIYSVSFAVEHFLFSPRCGIPSTLDQKRSHALP